MKKVTKTPKKLESVKKGYEARMLKMKEEILANAVTTGSNPTTNPSTTVSNPGTTAGTSASSITKCTDMYLYGVGSLAILAVRLSLFYDIFINGKKQAQSQQQQQAPIKTSCLTL